MSPSPSSHGRTVVTDGRLRGCGRGRSRTPSGPVRQRRSSSRNSTAASWRTITCSWSPASTTVDPRGGIARSPRTTTFSSASRGRPSSRTAWPTTASPSRTGNWITSAPSRLSSTGSTSGAGIAASSELHAEQPRHGLDRRALQHGREQHDEERDVEDRQPALDPLRHREGREHDRDRAAQAGPAEHEPLPHGEALPDRDRRASPAAGRARRWRARSRCPRARSSPRSSGNTSRPRIRNSASWAIQATPSWKVTIVRRAGVVAVPSTSPAR